MLVRGILLVLTLTLAANAREVISGNAHVVDADTIGIGEMKVRLQGIDAPETDQLCLDQNEVKWRCGIVARDRLSEHIAGRSITCMQDTASTAITARWPSATSAMRI